MSDTTAALRQPTEATAAAGWPEITTAFQPVVEYGTGRIVAYEALVRGADGADAGSVLRRVGQEQSFAFDQHCREVAVADAAGLGLRAPLSLNVRYFDARSCVASVQRTLAHAHAAGLRDASLVFEITECARIIDPPSLRSALRERAGPWQVVLDDFGSGRSGFALLERLRPDGVKLDRMLVHRAADNPASLAIVRWIVALAAQLKLYVIAKGVERPQDLEVLAGLGVRLFQGYLCAPPAVGRLPVPAALPAGTRR